MTASVGAVATQATAADAATATTAQSIGDPGTVYGPARSNEAPASAQPGEAAGSVNLVEAASTTTSSTTQSTATASKSKSSAKLSKAAKQKIKAHTAVSVAKKQIGDPYRWGASGPGAFDCSGLVLYAWRKAGVKLPRVAASQFRSVKKKVSWKNLKPGDLMFFYGLGHVGMYVGHGKMIHSPHSGTRVRIEKLSGYRKASFVGAVRPGA
ncbi:C40 family peptidase [Sphaerisporangium perillae]|uniref:C40 family peptidase n=1 Tax=Sphaerisporangium perillae TaxID=2935860 RepID=UPI00200BD938|nr:C40 family peptidase [Sphaerisporangium perillae]